MEITKKRIIAGLVAAVVVVLGTTSFTQCPWLKKQWEENVAPLMSSSPATPAPVSTE